jgi:hypothetical protein
LNDKNTTGTNVTMIKLYEEGNVIYDDAEADYNEATR